MTARRKLKDAIATSEELSFVFGQSSLQKITQATEEATEQLILREKIVCSFTFVPDRKPVRHYYDPEDLQQWALNDIQPNGIRSPLWVRPHPNQPGEYELVAGLRRFKAAEILNLKEVPAKVFDWDNQTAFEAAVSENVNRRDFSALEELDNTLRLLEMQLKVDTETVISLLYRMNNASKGTTNQNILVSPEAELVKQFFAAYGRITWQSFVATRLPLLKKPPEILERIRKGQIQYTKGILIASVKDTQTRRDILERAIGEQLSHTEIKALVRSVGNEPNDASQPWLKQRFTQTVNQMKKNKTLWESPEKTRQLEQLLQQLEDLVTIG